MKRTLVLMLILMMALGAVASAQSAGNLNDAGFIEGDGTNLYFSDARGVWKCKTDGTELKKIYEGPASMLQIYEGRLYFLSERYEDTNENGYALVGQTPVSLGLDGEDAKTLGAEKKIGQTSDFNQNSGTVDRYDSYVGYRGFTARGGYLYYLANTGTAGSYTSNGPYYGDDDQQSVLSVSTKYENGIALFRAELNGENEKQLTEVLGNSIARMALSEDKIYLAGGYADGIYAYNYVNYAILDLEGKPLFSFDNAAASDMEKSYFSDAGKFYHITQAVQPDGDGMYLSLSDSEGDFRASQLCRLNPDGTLTEVLIEQDFTPAIVEGGKILYEGSASSELFYDDSFDYAASLGVYLKDVGAEGLGEKLSALPDNEFTYGLKLSLVNGQAYFMGHDDTLYRAGAAGLEKLTEEGFAPAANIEYIPS